LICLYEGDSKQLLKGGEDMLRQFKHFISVFLVITMLFSFAVVSFANDPESIDSDNTGVRYSIIQYATASIIINGSSAKCSASLTAKTSTSLKIVMVLQKNTINGYTNLTTWSKTGTGTSLTLSKTANIVTSSTYRLKVTFTAGSESVTVYKYS